MIRSIINTLEVRIVGWPFYFFTFHIASRTLWQSGPRKYCKINTDIGWSWTFTRLEQSEKIDKIIE